jgi:TrpR-related protein YerC/YecD
MSEMSVTEPKQFELHQAFSSLKSEDEVEAFLADLCTPGELRAMSERWRAVQLVYDEVPYRKICELTGVSTATVTRVARALNEGVGYKTLINRLRRKKS